MPRTWPSLKIVQTFLSVLSLISACSGEGNHTVNKGSVYALCIEHIGAIDKPIFPIIIAVNAQSEGACRSATEKESGFFRNFVTSVTLPAEQITPIIDRVVQASSCNSEKQGHGDFGTFRWTILRNKQKTELETCRDESVHLLADLLKISQNKELSEALRDTLKRFRTTVSGA